MIACTDARCVGAVAGAVRERLALLAGAVARTATRRKDLADVRSDLDRAMVETLYQIDERFKRLRALASEREAALTEEVIATTSRLMAKLALQERACSLALDDARLAMLTAERFVPCPSVAFDERGNATLLSQNLLQHHEDDDGSDEEDENNEEDDENEEDEDNEEEQQKQVEQEQSVESTKTTAESTASGTMAKTASSSEETSSGKATTTTEKKTKKDKMTKKKQQSTTKQQEQEQTMEQQQMESIPNTPEAIGTLVDTLHLLGDADGSLRDVEGVRPGITTPHVRLSGAEAYEQLCGAVRGLCGVRVEMPPVRLAVAAAGGVWWNALMLEWRADSSCAAFMRLHGDAQYELQMRAPGEADFRALYRGPATEHTVRELLPQTTYDFRCRLHLATGDASPFCAPVAVTTSTPPGAFTLRDGPNYMLDTSRMIVTKTSTAKECWDATVVAAAPLAPRTVHRWFVRLRALHAPTAAVLVGVAPAAVDQSQVGNGNKCGWYLFSGISSLWSGPPQRMRNRILFGVTPLKAGDAVGVILDTTGPRGVLSFFITGHDWRVGYDDIPLDAPLVPCVILSEPNDCVEVVVF